MLIPILEWLLRTHCGSVGVNFVHADFRRCRNVPSGLANRIAFALEAYPCDSLFVHRDAERDTPGLRRQEIHSAIEGLGSKVRVPHICVVPVRMTEAWLLIDQTAIRLASGNPNGTVTLGVPDVASLEDKPDPKQLLHELLITASELTGRRRKSFNPQEKVHLVARHLKDFSPLRRLSAFRELEREVRQLIAANEGWNT